MEPEILLVDEVLAVGDTEFQKKCLGKMQEVSSAGRTVLVVSHNMATVLSLCKTGVLLEAGRVAVAGEIRRSVERYLNTTHGRSGSIISHLTTAVPDVDLLSVTVNGRDVDNVEIEDTRQPLRLEMEVLLRRPQRLCIEARLKDAHANEVAIFAPGHMDVTRNVHRVGPGSYTVSARVYLPKLNRGRCLLDLWLTNPGVATLAQLESAVVLDCHGYPVESGLVFDQGRNGAGYLLLDGDVNCSEAPSLLDRSTISAQ